MVCGSGSGGFEFGDSYSDWVYQLLGHMTLFLEIKYSTP